MISLNVRDKYPLGRDRELEILRFTNGFLVLLGSRKVGKSSLLRYLEKSAKCDRNAQPPWGYRLRCPEWGNRPFVHINLPAIGSEADFRCGLLTEIVCKLDIASGKTAALPLISDMNTLDRHLLRVAPFFEKITVALDGFEWLQLVWERGNLPDTFLEELTSIVRKHSNISLILAGTHQISEMNERLFGSLTSIATIRLGPLNKADAIELFQEPEFPCCTEDALNAIYTLTRGQPYLLNLLAHGLKRLEITEKVNPEEVEAVWNSPLLQNNILQVG